jgi:hypothetical protein
VNENVPNITVLIAARPAQAEIKAVTASRALDYPADKLEIIVARGTTLRPAQCRTQQPAAAVYFRRRLAPEPGTCAAR